MEIEKGKCREIERKLSERVSLSLYLLFLLLSPLPLASQGGNQPLSLPLSTFPPKPFRETIIYEEKRIFCEITS